MAALSPNEVEHTLKSYAISGITGITRLSSGYANQNYKIETEKGFYLYRICTQQADKDHLEYEIKILSELQKINFPAAYLVPRTDRGYISDSSQGSVLIYNFVDGSEPEISKENAAEIGHHIAVLNRFKNYKKYPRKNAINARACLDLIEAFKTAPNQYPDIFTYFEQQTHELIPCLTTNLPEGLIHSDVFPDNTLFREGRLAALIDFEEVCTDTLLMEIAMCINGFCFIDNRLQPPLVEALVTAYHQVRPMIDEEWDRLYDYICWTAHGMISWHLRFSLIHRENPRQLARVIELMERVTRLKSTPNPPIKRP